MTILIRYTHFFYALAPTPPFATVAASGEFCLGAAQVRSPLIDLYI
jgi:hypothetical protein